VGKLMKKIREFIEYYRWIRATQRFKKERFKKGRGEDFHHE
jgi:hypothetical protein